LRTAIKIFIEAINKLVDKACSEEIVSKMTALSFEIEGVLNVDDIKTRMFGDYIYVDIEISASPELTLMEAHSIAEKVHLKIESEFSTVKHCMVHVNPSEENCIIHSHQ
jgi:divalent metal cation (Fe/Co/Zn/Cd) transporter